MEVKGKKEKVKIIPMDDVIDLLSSVYYNDKIKAIKHAIYYLKEYKNRIYTFAYLEAEKRQYSWHDRFHEQPINEGEYLTFCHYRNGSTAYKIKLWKDYRFTSENDNVFFWMDLPVKPEGE